VKTGGERHVTSKLAVIQVRLLRLITYQASGHAGEWVATALIAKKKLH